MSSLAISIFVQISLLAAVSDNANITIVNNSTSNNAVASASPSSAASTTDASAPRNIASYAYSAAYKDAQDSGKPLVVLVGASWCPACQSMKTSVMPTVESQGGLNDVAFAYVNVDAEHDLAGRLMQGSFIPQLVVYEKTADGWTVNRLTGAQSPDTVLNLVRPAAARAIAARNAAQNPAIAAKQNAGKPAATQSSPAKQPTASHEAGQQFSTAG